MSGHLTGAAGHVHLSDDGLHRYWLRRELEGGLFSRRRTVVWVMLNPSTADHAADDPTMRRVIAFSRDMPVDQLEVVNLFSFRTPDPAALWRVPGRDGDPANLDTIRSTCKAAALVVVAWGAAADRAPGRVRTVSAMLTSLEPMPPVFCLGYTQGHQPRHPLFLEAGTKLERWPS